MSLDSMMKGLTGQPNHFLFLCPYLIRFCVGVLGDTGLILISNSVITPVSCTSRSDHKGRVAQQRGVVDNISN